MIAVAARWMEMKFSHKKFLWLFQLCLTMCFDVHVFIVKRLNSEGDRELITSLL
jgi:hypothetical protein